MRRPGLVVLMLAVACGERTPPLDQVAAPGSNSAPAPGTSEVDRPHVVFTRATMTIDRVGEPVTAPVTTPSTVSQDTMRSDDPTIVAVTPAGALVGMRAGTTVVRARASASALQVTVLEEGSIRVEPGVLELRPNGEAAVQIRAASGAIVSPEGVRWRIPPGTPVAVVSGQVMSLGGTGRFELEASVGASKATLPVVVRLPSTERIVVSPARARARIGEVVRLRLFGGSDEARAEWTSSAPSVLASLGDGLFQALHAGRARVCATALEVSSCSEVEVRP